MHHYAAVIRVEVRDAGNDDALVQLVEVGDRAGSDYLFGVAVGHEETSGLIGRWLRRIMDSAREEASARE